MNKAVLLLSGGIDSAVAASKAKEKNISLLPVHFYNKHLGDTNTVDKAKEVCNILDINELVTIPFDEQQESIVNNCSHEYYFILQRRLMWRIAEKIAEENNIDFLVTGENLAQVSSQTLSNMTTINESINLPVLRPLLGNDKQETVDEAKKIGTYEVSIGPEVCDLLGPDHPATSSNVETIKLEESDLDIKGLIEKAISEKSIV